MFLIAGISPKTKALESAPRICPSCGLAQAYLKRVDHYFSLFFIPLFPVKKGDPILVCNRCQTSGYDFKTTEEPETVKDVTMCSQCGRPLGTGFKYCPYCGHRQ